MRALLFLSLGLLTACPDPNASSSGMESSTTAAIGSDPSANTGSQETDPSAARLSCAEDDENCIGISGKLNFDGTVSGSIRLDVQKVRTGSAPMLIHTMELQSIEEAFSFDAPKGYGNIIITGFIDQAGDGPSPQDPQGRLNIEVKEEALTDLIVEVKADNALVQPKPPSDKPEDKSGSSGNNPQQAPAKDAPPVDDAPPADDAPPTDDAPPADQ